MQAGHHRRRKVHNISMTQALEVWSELWRAYYGNNDYGGHTAEIYAYTLSPGSPIICSIPGTFDAQKEALGLQAAESLHALLEQFASEADCGIEVNGKAFGSWVTEEPFLHRVHVAVTPLLRQ